MKTHTFVDVQNTEGTADFLGFLIDWKKLCDYLEEKYESEKNYFYMGIEEGDLEREAEFQSIESDRCILRIKKFKKYKKPDKVYPVTCSVCSNEFVKRVPGRFDWKCNCDVDLTVDAIESLSDEPIRALIFTGDGDFNPLIDKIMRQNENSRVYIFSSPKKIRGKSRLAIKLRALATTYATRVIFIDLNDLKVRIQKEVVIN